MALKIGFGALRKAYRTVIGQMKNWLGILFGLGFDTATEIGVLGIFAAEASKGLSFGAILVSRTFSRRDDTRR